MILLLYAKCLLFIVEGNLK